MPEKEESFKKDTRFKSGDLWTGNANGRPKGTTGSVSIVAVLKDLLNREIDWNDPETQEVLKKRLGDILALKLLERALVYGDLKAMQDIVDRIDGKPIQTQRFEGGNLKKIEVEFVDSGSGNSTAKSNEGSSEEPTGQDQSNSQ